MQSKLSTVAITATDHRAALKSAIKQHHAALELHARVQAAVEHAGDTVLVARAAVDDAETALAEAKTNEGTSLTDAALGIGIGSSTTSAELAATKARNDLEVARRTKTALQERLPREAAAVERARREVRDASVEVAKAEVPIAAMLAEAEALQADLIARRIVLRDLHWLGCVGDADLKAVETFLRHPELPAGCGVTEWADFSGYPAAGKVRAAIEQLRADAGAPLPA